MKYKLEHRIQTLARNAVFDEKDKTRDPRSFEIEQIKFSHWDFNIQDGWLTDYWLAETIIEAKNYHRAFKIFREKLTSIIPKISLISQCYIDSIHQPFLITKENSEKAFLRVTLDRKGVGLMFSNNELKALKKLLTIKNVPKEFYSYWLDATNSIGYTSKLLLIFSAIEALSKNKTGKKDFFKIKEIIGEELTKEIFGTKENSRRALRNRLVHGVYFSKDDFKKDYLDLLHKKIIEYFNEKILKDNLLSVNVTNPQRHFWGNRYDYRMFLQVKKEGYQLALKPILADFEKNGAHELQNYQPIFENLEKTF